MTNSQKEKWSRKLKEVCQTIIRTTSSTSSFEFPEDAATNSLFERLVDAIEDAFGTVVPDRIIDIAVYIEYSNRPENQKRFIGYLTQIPRKYTTTTLAFYRRRKYGMTKYEDLWLEQYGLSRQILKNLILEDTTTTIQGTPFEDPIRQRRLNQNVGYLLCHSRTSGWDPQSKICTQCIFDERCKKDLENSCPELYNQRIKLKK